MNKLKFNKLDDISKINYINDLLSSKNVLAEICIDLGIDPSDINFVFEGLGYEFDIITHKYIQKRSISHLNDNLIHFDAELLKDMYSKIDEVYNWYKIQQNLSNYTSIKIDKFKGETTSRNYKVYEDIQIEFKRFCEKHKPYKVQDLVSQAFKDFMEKYD